MSATSSLPLDKGREAKAGRGLTGLLLVALPILLLAWLIIYPIISAVIGTLVMTTPEGGGTFPRRPTGSSSVTPTACAISASRSGPPPSVALCCY